MGKGIKVCICGGCADCQNKEHKALDKKYKTFDKIMKQVYVHNTLCEKATEAKTATKQHEILVKAAEASIKMEQIIWDNLKD